jgi:hypothetical protein
LERLGGQGTRAAGPRAPRGSRVGGIRIRGKTPLELRLIPSADGERAEGPPVPIAIDRLEGPIIARSLSMSAPPSRLRYFLDGSQRTFDHYIPGFFPIAFSVAAVAILQRDDDGDPSVVPGTLQLTHTWFIPEKAPALPEIVDHIRSQNMKIVDPLERYEGDEAYGLALSDYSHFVDRAYIAAREAREKLETEVLTEWSRRPERGNDPNWIVVDGTLRVCAPRSIGVVKSFTRQHLTGQDAITLYDLPHGHRTTAFQATDNYRSDEDLGGLGDDLKLRTLWYMRLHDAAGKDARHGLVRIETDPRIKSTEEIDNLSSWLLSEKRPRANDARWANLLYPVHFLEQILKQYVDREYGIAARLVR